MRELNKLQSLLLLAGGVLMVVGAGCFVLMFHQQMAGWAFLAGAVLFAAMQGMQTYEGNSLVVRRLCRIRSLASFFFVLAGISMIDTAAHLLEPLFPDRSSYFTYLYNKWVVLLLIASLLEVYTVLRISSELKKD